MSEHSMNARMGALTDGVMSIAMTLLVLDIQVPDSVADHVQWSDLAAIAEHFYAYGLSFLVVALLWGTHARKFRGLRGYSGTLFWLNNLFLLFVGLVPFTASLLAASGNDVATRTYSGAMFLASLCLSLMSVHVTAAGLAHPDGARATLRPVHLLRFTSAAIFALSVALSFWSVVAAKAAWLLLIPANFIPERWLAASEA